MRTVLIPLLLFAAVAVWLVVRDTQERAEVAEAAKAPASTPTIDPAEVRRLKAMRAQPAPGIGDVPTRPGKPKPPPVGPADVEHAHAGLSLMLDHCFGDFQKREPEAKGRIELAFTLVKKDGYGDVEDIRILKDPFGDAVLTKCLIAGPMEPFPVPDGNGEMQATLGFDLPLNGGPPPGGSK